ncbi:hypothetical protein [Pseudobutyrivibrio sp.]
MWKELNKFEKAGLIIGGLQCIAGFGMAIYAHHKLMKQADENIEEIQANVEAIKNLDLGFQTPNIDEFFKQED